MLTRLSATVASLSAVLLISSGCQVKPEWTQFRYSAVRQADQYFENVLNKPASVSTLHPGWATPFHPASAGFFTSSPVVYNGKVYIGNSNGFFYAIDAATGSQLWQFPLAGGTPLDSQFHCNPSSHGIASSGAIASINGTDAVIFGAADRSSGAHLGDGHLFALNAATGTLIWESPALALVTGTTGGSTTQLHEQIGYSAPLVWFGAVYIGIADHCDDPIQQGKIKAVDLATGNLKAGFNFESTPAGTRGGGVWSSPAAFHGLLVTTGNTRFDAQPEPSPNNGLSMLRLDLNTGAVVWKHQPVPFSMDNDPDWAAGPAITWPSCGTVVVSTQKDGWTWALDETSATSSPSVRWAFPPGPWSTGGFHPGDGTVHGDTHYKRPGTSWGDVYVGTMGGYDTISSLSAGYQRLHALNVCGADAQRVRWLKDIPGTSSGSSFYALGPTTVTGGMFFVGTKGGHVVAVADPSIQPPLGSRCEDPSIPNGLCVGAGHKLVPDPWIKDVVLPGGGSDSIFGEPVLVDGHVYVATWAGNVYMLQP
jgi:outer membrane protein assembly factor BamB